MVIRINGEKADITVEEEKNVGEILTGLENWLANSGHRLSGLSIDGNKIDSSSLNEAFEKSIDDIKTLDIYTSNISDLTIESIINLIADIDEFENLDFNNKKTYAENWKKKPEALFAFEHLNDIYNCFINAFLRGNFDLSTLRMIMEERLREVEQPLREIKNLKVLIEETCEKLINLPLDLQTGKDASAASTMQFFTSIAEKIFRLIGQLEIQGYISRSFLKTYSDTGETCDTDESGISKLLAGFDSAVREIIDAYERKDSVLIGDLAEYEIAPKLQELYNSLSDIQGEK